MTVSEKSKVILWILYAADQMVTWGLLDGQSILNGSGAEYATELYDSGFKPTDEQIRECVMSLVGTDIQLCYEHQGEPMIDILKSYRDMPQRLKKWCDERGCVT
jgi:hypothetical protein